MSKAKHWCFTMNNYGDLPDPSDWLYCGYCIYQEEVGDEGTAHLQGYVQFSERRTLATVKELRGLDGAHWEVARGSLKDNVKYCSKNESSVGGPYIYGEPTEGQGSRSDLQVIKSAVDDGASRAQLYEHHFDTFARAERFILGYKRFKSVKRSWPMTVFLFVGTTGTGKTRTAHTIANYLGSVYNVPQTKGSGLYWDDYDAEESIIIDEMDGNRMTPTMMNLLLDRYPMEIPVHGSAGHQFCSRYIFITSNFHPKYWWKKQSSMEPFWRRVTACRKFLHVGVSPRTVVYNSETGQFIHK